MTKVKMIWVQIMISPYGVLWVQGDIHSESIFVFFGEEKASGNLESMGFHQVT